MHPEQLEQIQRAKGREPAALVANHVRHRPETSRHTFNCVAGGATPEKQRVKLSGRLVWSTAYLTYSSCPILVCIFSLSYNLVADRYRHSNRLHQVI